jgi:imidazole glycerol-phosphate synthase subunit HisH
MIPSPLILVDAGTGNLHSVHNALQKLGANVILTADQHVLRQGGRVILPGVGAFAHFMDGLRQRGLDQALREVVQRGDPLLGICVGMQAFFETSQEAGSHAGFGFLRGQVVRFPDLSGLKIPHTGWNQVQPQKPHPLLEGMLDGAYAYFNHSYFCAAVHAEDILALTSYGLDFPSMVAHENLSGVQFHPEKSQQVGLRILENFI